MLADGVVCWPRLCIGALALRQSPILSPGLRELAARIAACASAAELGVLARVRKALRPHVQRRICYVDQMRWQCWRVLLHRR